jgi:hypothetical protein
MPLFLLENWKSIGIGLLLLFAVGGAYLKGDANGSGRVQARWDKEKATVVEKVAEVKVQQAEANVKVITEYVDRVVTVTKKADAIIKEVPIYVTKQDDDKCGVIGAGFVRVWNAANSNTPLAGDAPKADGPAGQPEVGAPQGQPQAERGGDAARPGGQEGQPDGGADHRPPELDQDAKGSVGAEVPDGAQAAVAVNA